MAIQSTYMDSRVSLQGCSPEFSHNLLLSHCKFIIPYLSILKIDYQLCLVHYWQYYVIFINFGINVKYYILY